jgi:aromatic ring-opening dioxygenase catalytic subunit (LigB family)
VFVPLLGLMPEADIPVVAVSVISSMDPKVRIAC